MPRCTAAALAAVRERVPGTGPDRALAPELETAAELVRSGAVVAARAEIGELR